MSSLMISEEEVKNALQIKSFRNLSKTKIMEFVSAIPNMDKDVAIAIIEQFPAYSEYATTIISQLNTLCDDVLKSNESSQKNVIEAYKKVLNSLSEQVANEGISSEERATINEQMILVANKIAELNTENKEFLEKFYKFGLPIIGGALVLGAAILGVNVKGVKIPTLKK